MSHVGKSQRMLGHKPGAQAPRQRRDRLGGRHTLAIDGIVHLARAESRHGGALEFGQDVLYFGQIQPHERSSHLPFHYRGSQQAADRISLGAGVLKWK
jgi:hypothetical protein